MKHISLKHLLVKLAAAACLFTSACGTASSPATSSSSASAAPAAAKAKWTVLIYMNGTNLESEGAAASGNLEALSKASASDDVNFIIQTGGCKQWQYEKTDIAEDRLQRYRMNGGEMSLIEEEPLANMGDPVTLESFLNWGVKQYPADRYMAILWDHGGGALGGALNDEIYKSGVTTQEIGEAFKAVGTKFEIIGFDACLMSSMEVAAELSPYSHYMIASEEVEPGAGWDYSTLGSTLVDQPDIGSTEFGRILCDSYIGNLEKEQQAEYSTMAMTDLEKIQPVVDAFSDMASAMSECIQDPQKFTVLSLELRQSKHYFIEAERDLVDFARRAEILDPKVTKKVVQAVQNAIVCKTCGSEFNYNNGLTVYYKLNDKPDNYTTYATVCPSMQYLAFLDAVNYNWRAPASIYEKIQRAAEPEYASYLVDYELVDGNPVSSLRINHGTDCLTSVDYLIYQIDETNHYYLTAKLPNLQVDADNITFHPYFDGMAATIGGEPCYLKLIEEQNDYTLFGIPVMYDGQEFIIRVLWKPSSAEDEQTDFEQSEPDASASASAGAEVSASPAASASASAAPEASPSPSATAVTPLSEIEWGGASTSLASGTFQILGIWDQYSSASGLPGRNTIALEDGMEFTIELPEADTSGDPKMMYASGSFVYHSDTTVEMAPITDGLYAICYEMSDALGRTYDSDLIPVQIKDGNFQSVTWESLLAG
jgi:hypothetical protein